jgi:hypothetical protein
MWNDLDLGVSHAALWTESAVPLPHVPPREFLNFKAINTISTHPELFKIVTCINISQFKELLVSHPHQPLVESVVQGLTYGFWPHAHTHYGTYPTTLDDSGPLPKTIEQADFLRKQIQTEFKSE